MKHYFFFIFFFMLQTVVLSAQLSCRIDSVRLYTLADVCQNSIANKNVQFREGSPSLEDRIINDGPMVILNATITNNSCKDTLLSVCFPHQYYFDDVREAEILVSVEFLGKRYVAMSLDVGPEILVQHIEINTRDSQVGAVYSFLHAYENFPIRLTVPIVSGLPCNNLLQLRGDFGGKHKEESQLAVIAQNLLATLNVSIVVRDNPLYCNRTMKNGKHYTLIPFLTDNQELLIKPDVVLNFEKEFLNKKHDDK